MPVKAKELRLVEDKNATRLQSCHLFVGGVFCERQIFFSLKSNVFIRVVNIFGRFVIVVMIVIWKCSTRSLTNARKS